MRQMKPDALLQFYENLTPLNQMTDIFDDAAFTPAPENWMVVVTDVVNSTGAIEEGRYKEVNSAGGLAVSALTNLTRGMEFPFIFGGDGMVFLLPGELEPQTRDVLADTRAAVAQIFGLELRAGMVPVRDLYSAGHELGVARVRVSEQYDQAILSGTGIDEADRMIKAPGSKYLIPAGHSGSDLADFSGFSCRWKDIPSHLGVTLAVIVRPVTKHPGNRAEILRQVYNRVERLLGPEEEYHPLPIDLQVVSTDNLAVRAEAGAMARATRGFGFLLWKLWVRLQRVSTRLIIRYGLNIRFMGKLVRTVREDNRVNADFRKFDGTLKMVVACTQETRGRIEQLLERFHEAGFIHYGTHASDRAIMTCVVHVDSHHEVHFVDAAGGGYALAAAMMKRQIG